MTLTLCRSKVHLVIEDESGKMELMVFGKTIEKLTGATFAQLLSLCKMDKMNIPGPISTLVNQMKKVGVVLTSREIKTGKTSFKMVSCDNIKEVQSYPKKTKHPSTLLDTSQERTTSSTPIAIQTYPNESPAKKIKLR